jgi:hypothetical protein
LDPTEKRIRKLQSHIEKLDQVDIFVGLDIGGHVIIELDRSDVQAVKAFLDNRYLKEIDDHRRLQRMVSFTKQHLKEGNVQ